MDKSNLERLRAKYLDASADDIFDPEMKRLSTALFSKTCSMSARDIFSRLNKCFMV